MRPKSPMDMALWILDARRAKFPFREGTTAATGEAVELRSGVGFRDVHTRKFWAMHIPAKPTPDARQAALRALCGHRPLPKGDFGRAALTLKLDAG